MTPLENQEVSSSVSLLTLGRLHATFILLVTALPNGFIYLFIY